MFPDADYMTNTLLYLIQDKYNGIIQSKLTWAKKTIEIAISYFSLRT
jgi:hypothetical protein